MRDYAKVAPQFWTGRTGKALKAAGPEAVIVAMYLMTSPHANMIGVYHCPVAYISIDTGLTLEGASKGLASAIEADFCTFDETCDYVFVHAFAEYQIGSELSPGDNRVKGVINELSKVPKGQCWQGFRARYAVPFNLPAPANQPPKPEAPSKPLRSQEQEQEKEQKRDISAAPRPTRKCPPGFVVTDDLLAWAREKVPGINVETETETFRDYTFSTARSDWAGTWRNWMRKAAERPNGKRHSAAEDPFEAAH